MSQCFEFTKCFRGTRKQNLPSNERVNGSLPTRYRRRAREFLVFAANFKIVTKIQYQMIQHTLAKSACSRQRWIVVPLYKGMARLTQKLVVVRYDREGCVA